MNRLATHAPPAQRGGALSAPVSPPDATDYAAQVAAIVGPPGSHHAVCAIFTDAGARSRRASTLIGVYPADRPDVIARDARRHSEDPDVLGAYLTINPVTTEYAGRFRSKMVLSPAGRGDGASDVDIVGRRWLIFDVDPRRATGHEKASATAAEKAMAMVAARALFDGIVAVVPVGVPVVATDSGNGCNIYVRVTLPAATPLASQLIDAARGLVDAAVGDAVDVDGKVANAARLVKVPGSWSKKGVDDAANGRPWRRCGVLPWRGRRDGAAAPGGVGGS